MSITPEYVAEDRQRQRNLLLSAFRRNPRPTRTDLINLVRALIYGPVRMFGPHGTGPTQLKRQRGAVALLITRAVAEGDIVEVPLARAGTCAYRIRQESDP